jgi:transcriptional regulator with XRE-family HTH domain
MLLRYYMVRKNMLLTAPPFAVEDAISQLGSNLRTARLRRNLTIQEVASKIGTGPRAIADAEKGKISSGIGIYVALLWTYDLLEHFYTVAAPGSDDEGQAIERAKGRKRARQKEGDIDNEF